LLLLKTSDFRDYPDKVSADLCTFLNLAPFEGEIGWVNAAAAPKNKTLEKLFTDRGSLPRRLIRNLLPQKIKHWVMRSGLPGKMHKKNQRQKSVEPLTTEEKSLAKAYFSEDLKLLKENFGIEF
jgi:hypothetical protein